MRRMQLLTATEIAQYGMNGEGILFAEGDELKKRLLSFYWT